MFAPSSEPSRRRSVNTSSSAWVGCSCLPSPALITAAVGPAGDQLGGAGVGRADHDRGRVVGRQRLDRVLERLALVDARAGRADADDVGAESLGGELEARARAGARLVEEVDDRAASERRHLLDLAAGDLGERLGAVEDPLDPGAVQVVDRDQVAADPIRAFMPLARRAARWPASIVTSSSAVDLLDADVDPLLLRGRDVLADVVGADRELAMAAVDEHRELDPGRAAVVEDLVDRGADRAAGVERRRRRSRSSGPSTGKSRWVAWTIGALGRIARSSR